MLPSNLSAAEELLHRLLDRFEEPKERVRDITQAIDYRRVGTPAQQDEFHRVLREAEAHGAIALERNRFHRSTGELARVRLNDAARLYTFLVRTPALPIAEKAADVVRSAIPEILAAPLFAEILSEAFAAWRSNKSYLGFTPEQVDSLVIVLRLSHAILNLTGRDVDHRTFSRRIVKDSKALERFENSVVNILKRADEELLDDEFREVLEAFGIVRRPHSLHLKGPIRLISDYQSLEGTGDLFVGLPWGTVQRLKLSAPVDYVITIENPTSFWRYCSEVGGNYLAMLTDGFPARDVLSSMVHLVTAARDLGNTPIYHWGDIDAGGVRIAAHLGKAFGLTPILHQMEPALAVKFGSPLKSRKGLATLAENEGEIGTLAQWLLSDGAQALEQEELDPLAPAPRSRDQ